MFKKTYMLYYMYEKKISYITGLAYAISISYGVVSKISMRKY